MTRSTLMYLPPPFDQLFKDKQLIASPAVDFAMLGYTLMKKLGREIFSSRSGFVKPRLQDFVSEYEKKAKFHLEKEKNKQYKSEMEYKMGQYELHIYEGFQGDILKRVAEYK